MEHADRRVQGIGYKGIWVPGLAPFADYLCELCVNLHLKFWSRQYLPPYLHFGKFRLDFLIGLTFAFLFLANSVQALE